MHWSLTLDCLSLLQGGLGQVHSLLGGLDSLFVTSTGLPLCDSPAILVPIYHLGNFKNHGSSDQFLQSLYDASESSGQLLKTDFCAPSVEMLTH